MAQAPAIERAAIQPVPSVELSSSKYTRLESCAFSMIHASLHKSISEQVLGERTLNCLSALFLILKSYQLGGLQERSRLIEALCSPGVGSGPKDRK